MAGYYSNPPVPGLDPDADASGTLNALAIITIFSTSLVLSLRLFARRVGRTALFIDDWLMILATSLVWLFCGALLYETHHLHVGQHIAKASKDDVTLMLKLGYGLCFVLQYAYGLTKLSVIAFYWRLFKTSVIRWPLIIMFILVLAWSVAYTFVNTFWCWPIRAFWTLEMRVDGSAKCIPELPELLGNTISDLILDATLLVLPLLAVHQLQLGLDKKLALSAVFMLGILTTTSCGMRLWQSQASLAAPGFDPTYSGTNVWMWAILEAGLGVITACLPTMGHLVQFLWHGSNKSRALRLAGTPEHYKSGRKAIGPISKPFNVGGDEDWFMLDDDEEKLVPHTPPSRVAYPPAIVVKTNSRVRRGQPEQNALSRGFTSLHGA